MKQNIVRVCVILLMILPLQSLQAGEEPQIKLGSLHFSRDLTKELKDTLGTSFLDNFEKNYLAKAWKSIKKSADVTLTQGNQMISFATIDTPPVTLDPSAIPGYLQVLADFCKSQKLTHVIVGHLREDLLTEKFEVVIRLFDCVAYQNWKGPKHEFRMEVETISQDIEDINTNLSEPLQQALLRLFSETEPKIEAPPPETLEPEEAGQEVTSTKEASPPKSPPEPVANANASNTNLLDQWENKPNSTENSKTDNRKPIQSLTDLRDIAVIAVASQKRHKYPQRLLVPEALPDVQHVYKMIQKHGFYCNFNTSSYHKNHYSPPSDFTFHFKRDRSAEVMGAVGFPKTILVTSISKNSKFTFEWHPNPKRVGQYRRADKVLAELNGKAYGGHKDWRIPTIFELFTLVSEKQNNTNGLFIPSEFKLPQNIKKFGFISKTVGKDIVMSKCNDHNYYLGIDINPKKEIVFFNFFCTKGPMKNTYLIPVRSNNKL